jgi:thiamine-phosphate pyrophosphorylase
MKRALRFCLITDHQVKRFPPLDQVCIAIEAGATFVQYRCKCFTIEAYPEVEAICRYCHEACVPIVVNDNVLLAKAVGANGVHVGQEDTPPSLARRIMGPDAIIGISVSTMAELKRSDLSVCDYIGSGPVHPTGTKADAKAVRGLSGLKEIVEATALPTVTIGGIDAERAPACFSQGAFGVAVIGCITRAEKADRAALTMAAVCKL